MLIRKTRQRDALKSTFETAKRPLTPSEAHVMAVEDNPSLGIATVYRAVKEFVAENYITPVQIGGVTRYELADKTHHHHFYCQRRDKAFCLENCPVPDAHLAPRGFKVKSHELTVIGLCDVCNRDRKAWGSRS